MKPAGIEILSTKSKMQYTKTWNDRNWELTALKNCGKERQKNNPNIWQCTSDTSAQDLLG